jgi:hypothetical protein
MTIYNVIDSLILKKIPDMNPKNCFDNCQRFILVYNNHPTLLVKMMNQGKVVYDNIVLISKSNLG